MITTLDPVDQWQPYKEYYNWVNMFRRESDLSIKKKLYSILNIKIVEIRKLYNIQMASFDYSTELWKPVIGFDGKYEVSNFGRIKNLKRKGVLSDRINIGCVHLLGYVRIKLCDKNGCPAYPIHCIEGQVFLPPQKNRNQFNHINLIKSYNVLSNLERCTNAENQIHSFASGTRTRNHNIGDECSYSKLTNEEVLNIKLGLNAGKTGRELARIYSVSEQTISSIKHYRNWKHI